MTGKGFAASFHKEFNFFAEQSAFWRQALEFNLQFGCSFSKQCFRLLMKLILRAVSNTVCPGK